MLFVNVSYVFALPFNVVNVSVVSTNIASLITHFAFLVNVLNSIGATSFQSSLANVP